MNSNLNFLPELAVLPSWVCWRHDKDIKYNRDEKNCHIARQPGSAYHEATQLLGEHWTRLTAF